MVIFYSSKNPTSLGRRFSIFLIAFFILLTSVEAQTLIPFASNNSVTCGTNTTLCTHAGCGVPYSNSASGYTVLNASGSAVINISGSYVTETNYDYIRIYSGVGIGGALLQTYHGTGSINYTGAAGQTLTVQFTSDGSVTYSGLNANVTYTGVCSSSCTHTLELRDSYGDGWNGGSVSLYVAGTLIGSYTLATGFGPNSISFSASTGQAIQVVYTAGSWAYENYFNVISGTGGSLVSNYYPSSSGTWNGTAACTPPAAPANDACANAINIAALPYTSAVVSNATATDDVPISTCDGPYKNIWWKVTGVCGTMTANTCTGSTNFDSEIAVFTGSCGSMTQVGCNDDACGLQSSVTWSSTAGTIYYIAAGSYYSAGATGNIQLNVTATPYTLSTQPTSISGTSTLCSGLSSTLTAVGGSDGTGAIYEWFTGSCGGTAAGTGISLSVTPSTSTTYFVRRTGTCNSTACASVLVTVNNPSTTSPTVLSNGDYVWSGNMNSDWSTANNWLVYNNSTFGVAGSIPAGTSNVFIRANGSCASNTATTAAGSVVACNNISIESGKALIAGSGSTLNVSGNWTNNGSFTASTGTISFKGSQQQRITAGGSSFYNVMMNNTTVGTADINLTDPMIITNNGTFTDGILYYSGTGAMSFANGAVCPNGGSSSSFVNTAGAGFVSKTGTNAFIFPVGEISVAGVPVWAPVEIAAPAVVSTITADYNFAATPNNLNPALMCDLSIIDHTSGIEHWLLTTTAATPAITLYWKDGTRSGISSPSDLLVAHWEDCGGTNKWVSKGASVSGTASSGSITSTFPFSSYSPVSFWTKNYNNPLPVALLEFSVACQNGLASIQWSTASETNNDFFSIEKSPDMETWETVNVVPGAGNSNSVINYSIMDPQVFSGTSYYRLKQTDFDGKFTYTDIRSLDCGNAGLVSTSLYPNPAEEFINIQILAPFAQKVIMHVYDIFGQNVFSKEINVDNQFTYRLDLGNLAAGTYTIAVVSGSEIYNAQFVKLKSGNKTR
jgi:hypothetical protein